MKTRYTERAEDVLAKRYIPSWLFRLLRVQKLVAIQIASFSKYILGSTFLILSFVGCVLVLLALLPSRVARIKFCNQFGTLFGKVMMVLSGSKVTIRNRERFDGSRPAIYITNHTSILDIFLMMWLTPSGTCSVAKKQIVYYPLYGILFMLSGHLMIDRGNSAGAIKSMKSLEKLVRKDRLSVVIFPEGTRSRNGRLLPFKKGVVHLAIQTGLPVVPCVISGAHKAWRARALTIGQTEIICDVLPTFDTSHWTLDNIDGALEELQLLYNEHLPLDQRLLNLPGEENGQVIVTDWAKKEENDKVGKLIA
jgi:1-acyl-sn-glycerol-3-phosphate acyltransferase